MALVVLRRGSRGADVSAWQYFLIGQINSNLIADGIFGQKTYEATVQYQRLFPQLSNDGIVGPQTYSIALQQGLQVDIAGDPSRDPVDRISGSLSAPNTKDRIRMFGEFDYAPTPSERNREKISVDQNWVNNHIVTIYVPQLHNVTVGGTRVGFSGQLQFHRNAQEQLLAFFSKLGTERMLGLLKTYDGAYVPRFIRGSQTTLSSHAWASAIDLNASWNRLGHMPAPRGDDGSMIEIAEVAAEYGFYWGGNYRNRKDGMHLEVAKLL